MKAMPPGYSVRISDPPVYQRAVDGAANVLLLPFVWLNVLEAGDLPKRLRAPYKVSLVTANGKEWTLAVAESPEEATQREAQVSRRIAGIGFDAWATEVALPDRFMPS